MPTSPKPPTPWPWTTGPVAPIDAGPGLGAVLEAQMRLWNHLLDANRSLWSFYAPWLQAGPWGWIARDGIAGSDDAGTEPATTADGIPDALELQARSWNRFLDAHRNFWTAASWPVPAAPWTAPTAANETPGHDTDATVAHAATAPRKTPARPRSGRR